MTDQDRADVMKKVLDLAKADTTKPRSRMIAVRILKELDGLNQSDEHLAEKHGRIDAGQATERVETIMIEVVGMERKMLPAPEPAPTPAKEP